MVVGMDQAAIADALKISPKTLTRTLQGKREMKDKEMRALLDELDVPEWFLRSGFTEGADDGSEHRLERIENLVTGVAADVADIRRRLEGGI